MSDFEWRRALRALQQDQPPRHDLWERIEQALPAATMPQPHSRTPLWLLAASFAGLTLLALGLSLQQQPQRDPVAWATADRGAERHWKPDDPRLAGAAVELDAARMELRLALQQAPASNGLQRLLDRTNRQLSRLRQRDQAG